MNPAPLTISLFGPFEVTVHGQPMRRLRSRSLEWLLAWLVLRHGRPLSRAVLAGTLWPDSGHEPALGNLRTGLLDLRRALGPEAARLGAPTRDSLQLDLTGAIVDLLRFDAAIAAGDERSLREAVALYRGELLEGCHEEWIIGERAARQEACLLALERLVDLALTRGEAAAALGYLHRAETLDPLRDSVQQRRMQALAASGDLPAALLAYREYRLRLHREMNLEPDPETTRLFRELQAGRGVRRGEGATGGHRNVAVVDGPAQGADGVNIGPDAPAQESLPSPVVPSRFPRPLTALIGREVEAAEVSSLVTSSRLVTLIGGGGVGKTRLALQVAGDLEPRYRGRVLFVELAPLADPGLLPSFIAAALGLHEEAQPDAGRLLQTLSDWLSPAPTLLVLDNCEHLIEAAAELAQRLLTACPELRILATSRQRLGISGETAWRVPSLPAPDPEALPADAAGAMEQALQFPAARLFVERAKAVRPAFQLGSGEEVLALARICRRLDGIPLALELAAARVTVLDVAQIAARLDDRFQLLTGGGRAAIPRHQTLRALIDWSYDGLPEAEAALLRRLSVFAGGWTLEAAEAVCSGIQVFRYSGIQAHKDSPVLDLAGPEHHHPLRGYPTRTPEHPADILDLLDALEECSLVLAEAGASGLRYRMLETVREYAREKLQACGEEATVRSAHAAYFLALAETAAPEMHGSEQLRWLNVLEAEHDNLRAALERTQADAPERFLRLAAALWPFWEARGYLSEGRHHLRAALQPSGLPDAPERAQALLGAARLALHQGDLHEADTFAQESQEWFRSRDDSRGKAMALLCRGEVAFARGQFVAAESLFADALEACRESGWSQGSARALVKLGAVAMMLADTPRARARLEEGLAVAETLGDAPTLASALYERGSLAMREADDTRAGALLEQSVEIWRRLGHKQATAEALGALGRLAGRQQDRPRAVSFLEQAAATYRELGARIDLAWRLQEVGNVHFAGGAYTQARAAYEESLSIFRELDDRHGIACADNNLGMTCLRLGDPAGAQALHREALAIYQSRAHEEGMTWSLEQLGLTEARLGDAPRAARLLAAAAAARESLDLPAVRQGQAEWDQSIAALRAGLPDAAFETAWAEGHAMSLDQAAEYASSGADTYPPPASRALAPSRLSRPLTALIGREGEVEEVSSLVTSSRLVTLIGGGGVGKTRLALQVAAGLADQYPGRTLFVELAPLADPALLPAVVAAGLGLHEEAAPESHDLMQALTRWLSLQPALLVLDNCEHLIDAAAELAQRLLAACPELRILATSRQRLGVTGEIAWRVPSLPAPDPEQLPADAASAVEQLLRFPAAQLFVERAAAMRPGFRIGSSDEARAVARICRRLDGIPLALELAAARMPVLSATQIAARLDDRFRLLTGGSRDSLPRHQTLRALIDWSYDGLPEAEAALLRRLSVFAGGWTLEAAEAVCSGVQVFRCSGVRADKDSPALDVAGPEHHHPLRGYPTRTPEHPDAVLDLLGSLVDRSLVLAEEAAEGLRYRMLETVREYES